MDLHCHLDLYERPTEMVREVSRRGLVVFSVTTTPSAFARTREMSNEVASIYTGIGLHPQIVHQRFAERKQLYKLIDTADFVGEIGLDGGSEFKHSWGMQMEVFTEAVITADRFGGRILSVHSRRAAAQVIKVIETHGGASTPIMHWFSGTLRQLNQAIALGCWFSVGPAMLRGSKGRTLVKSMPKDRVVLETDGPFTMSDDRPYRPWDAGEICPIQIAEVWGLSEAAANKQLASNLRNLLPLMNRRLAKGGNSNRA